MTHDYFCLDAISLFRNTLSVSKNVFFAGLILSASGYLSPPFALAAGLIYGFTFIHPYHLDAKRLSKLLLQVSVVGLGFGMDLQQVLHAGRSGFIYTAVSITFCNAAWLGAWKNPECEKADLVSHFCRHGDLRR